MELKFTDNMKTGYNEEGQSNPIRFQIYKSNLDTGEYTAVTGKFRCKDFFNDVVVAHNSGEEISIYGFKAYQGMLNKDDPEGVPVVLYNIQKGFDNNFQLANDWLIAQGFPPLSFDKFDDKEYFVYIPWEYFKNTFYISAISLLIRACNTTNNIDDLTKVATMPPGGGHNDPQKLGHLLTRGMDLGDSKGYLFYYKKSQAYPGTYKKDYSFGSLVHNCGVVHWGKDFNKGA